MVEMVLWGMTREPGANELWTVARLHSHDMALEKHIYLLDVLVLTPQLLDVLACENRIKSVQ